MKKEYASSKGRRITPAEVEENRKAIEAVTGKARQQRTVTARSVGDVFPAFAVELADLARKAGRGDLSAQFAALPVVARCTCGQDDCAHFYVAPPPDGAYGDGHSNVRLPADAGIVVLDLVDDRVVGVEVLNRADVKAALDSYMPAGP